MARTLDPAAFRLRLGIILAFAAVCVVGVFFVPRIAQDDAYHGFADSRPLWGIPNFGDVMSNAPFAFIGIAALLWLRTPAASYLEPVERAAFVVLFIGIALTSVGSAYYHWAPDSPRLVWDRLPMTIGFMSLFSAVICERLSVRAGGLLLVPLLIAGAASVAYWHHTEQLGAGDLRPYALVQFFPLMCIPLMALLFPARYIPTGQLFVALGWYGLAKALEHWDKAIFDLVGHAVSGHSLKHLAAAVGAYWVLRILRSHKPA